MHYAKDLWVPLFTGPGYRCLWCIFFLTQGGAMKCIPVQEAVGLRLCHDITQIIPGKSKWAAFRRGHVVTPGDIDHLLRLGK